jgi:hypothetical protein
MAMISQQRTSRLSTMIDTPGGVSVAVAMAQATAHLDTIKPRGMELITCQLGELAAMSAPTGPDERAKSRAYGLSAGILDAAGPFQMNDLCAAASGLCDLLDTSPEGEVFDWRIVTVHVQAMQLMQTLATGPAGDEARSRVLSGLRDVLKAKLHQAG